MANKKLTDEEVEEYVAEVVQEQREKMKSYMYYILDSAGSPVEADHDSWEAWMRGNPIGLSDSQMRVAITEIDDIVVSTVFLHGINHNFGDGPPLLFETMVFGGDYNEAQWRYTTRAEAVDGHLEAVALVKQALRLRQKQWLPRAVTNYIAKAKRYLRGQ